MCIRDRFILYASEPNNPPRNVLSCPTTLDGFNSPIENPIPETPIPINYTEPPNLILNRARRGNDEFAVNEKLVKDLTTRSYFFDRYVEKFPLNVNRIHKIIRRTPIGQRNALVERIAWQIENTRIIVDSRAEAIANRFLEKKQQSIKPVDAIYKSMTLKEFVLRLIVKRPLSFYSIVTEKNQKILDLTVLLSLIHI